MWITRVQIPSVLIIDEIKFSYQHPIGLEPIITRSEGKRFTNLAKDVKILLIKQKKSLEVN